MALVAEPATAGSRLWGAAFWPRKGRPVLALTGRFKTADHLWFSLFHEAGHLLLHGDRDILEMEGNRGDLETEADRYARGVLLPDAAYRKLTAGPRPALATIRATAREHALAVDSLIGMLEHDKYLTHAEYRHLKRAVDFDELCASA